jgi:hypothetical protein
MAGVNGTLTTASLVTAMAGAPSAVRSSVAAPLSSLSMQLSMSTAEGAELRGAAPSQLVAGEAIYVLPDDQKEASAVVAAAVLDSEPPLPEGWSIGFSDEGVPYYVGPDGVPLWERPPGV